MMFNRQLELLNGKQYLAIADASIHGGEFLKRVNSLKISLKKAGIEPKSHIALIHDSNFNWLAAFIALTQLDAIIVPMDNTNSIEELTTKINFTDIDFILSDKEFAFKAASAVIDQELDLLNIKLYRRASQNKKEVSCRIIVSSSGTGGHEKFIMHSEESLLALVQYYMDEMHHLSQFSTVLSILPLTAIYPLAINLACLFTGKNIVYSHPADPQLIKLIPDKQIGVIPAVPLLIEKIHNNIWDSIQAKGPHFLRKVKRIVKCCYFIRKITHINAGKYIFKDIHAAFGMQFKHFLCGGAALNQSVLQNMYAFGFSIYEGYGLTETCGALTMRKDNPSTFGSVGKPLTDVAIRLSEEGEILIKTPRIMTGYYKEDALTQESFDGLWFKTGDIGFFDEHSNLVITGRIKEIIVKGDERKYLPSSIEEKYLDIPGINELAVIGVQSPNHSGDLVVIYVVIEQKAKQASIEKEIFIRSNLYEYAYKVDRVIFVMDIPKNKLGKICRSVLKMRAGL